MGGSKGIPWYSQEYPTFLRYFYVYMCIYLCVYMYIAILCIVFAHCSPNESKTQPFSLASKLPPSQDGPLGPLRHSTPSFLASDPPRAPDTPSALGLCSHGHGTRTGRDGRRAANPRRRQAARSGLRPAERDLRGQRKLQGRKVAKASGRGPAGRQGPGAGAQGCRGRRGGGQANGAATGQVPRS